MERRPEIQLEQALRGTTVADVMSKELLRASPGACLEALIEAVLGHHIGAVPVVEADGTLLGMVEREALLRRAFQGGDTHEVIIDRHARSLDGNLDHVECLHTVLDAMEPVRIAFSEAVPLSYAVAVMAHEHESHVPVIDSSGRLVGMVTHEDILRRLAQCERYVLGDDRPHFSPALREAFMSNRSTLRPRKAR